jgi:hypothetical protein
MLDALAGGAANSVGAVVRALYLPWLDSLANRFRQALEEAGPSARPKPLVVAPGACVLFVDGLRYDLARRLADRLAATDNLRLSWRLAPIPTVTATAKALVTPVADAICGVGRADAFMPLESSSGRPATTDRLLAAMRARGIQILDKTETRGPLTPTTIGWTECGHLDSDGHHLGARLAGQIEAEIDAIARRVEALRRAGWARIQIVTDHGWLLVPGGLPKAVIAASIVETAWSRVALLGEGAAPEASALPWHWDANVRVAVPPGASAFRAGEEYAHGGISPQESVIPEIIVGEDSGGPRQGDARIESLSWRRYRLSVMLTGPATDYEVEVRRSERDAASRIMAERIGADGEKIDLRVDPDMEEETPVFVVLLDAFGSVVDARKTSIGER